MAPRHFPRRVHFVLAESSSRAGPPGADGELSSRYPNPPAARNGQDDELTPTASAAEIPARGGGRGRSHRARPATRNGSPGRRLGRRRPGRLPLDEHPAQPGPAGHAAARCQHPGPEAALARRAGGQHPGPDHVRQGQLTGPGAVHPRRGVHRRPRLRAADHWRNDRSRASSRPGTRARSRAPRWPGCCSATRTSLGGCR
jgi:hypothetical protein